MKGRWLDRKCRRFPLGSRGRVWHMTNRGYPAVKEGDGWVYGELVELKDFAAVIDTMDNIEGYYGPGDSRNEYAPHPFPSRKSGDRSHRRSICVLLCPDDLGTPDNPALELAHGSWRTFMEENK